MPYPSMAEAVYHGVLRANNALYHDVAYCFV
jgi:hypothetical protein